MKSRLKNRLFAFAICTFGLAAAAVAQPAATTPAPAPATTDPATTSPASGPGLLGTTYAGVEFGYTDQAEGEPSVMRRYGFVYNQPLPEGLDFTFSYDHMRANDAGGRMYSNGFLLGLTGYVPNTWGKPFLNGDIGWKFRKQSGVKEDSFHFKVKAGVEFQLLPALVVVPYLGYWETPHLNQHAWIYGAKAVYRFNRQWSGGLGLEVDDQKNAEYIAAIKFHY